MLIVGGTYRERCTDPTRSQLLGSGARAACVVGPAVDRFVTVLEDSSVPELQAVSGLPLERLEIVTRAQSIDFVYETPIARPAIYGDDQPPTALEVDHENVVAFGMVEATLRVNAQRCVVDPQSSMSLAHVQGTVVADELVIVANVAETRAMAGTPDLSAAIEHVLSTTGATAVITKAGIGGCIVRSADSRTSVLPALPTSTVWPIGSGDAFTAGFAAHWFEHGDPHAAAGAGCATAAAVCSSGQLSGGIVEPTFSLEGLGEEDLTVGPMVYLAASFASTSQRWLLRHVERKMRDIGIRPFSPLHENGAYKGDAVSIAESDLAGIAACDAVLLLADGSRTGPWVEAGWATRLGLPIVIFTEDVATDRFTMLVGTGALVVSDLATAIYQSGWHGLARRLSA